VVSVLFLLSAAAPTLHAVSAPANAVSIPDNDKTMVKGTVSSSITHLVISNVLIPPSNDEGEHLLQVIPPLHTLSVSLASPSGEGMDPTDVQTFTVTVTNIGTYTLTVSAYKLQPSTTTILYLLVPNTPVTIAPGSTHAFQFTLAYVPPNAVSSFKQPTSASFGIVFAPPAQAAVPPTTSSGN
jgi:hypothetical protein